MRPSSKLLVLLLFASANNLFASLLCWQALQIASRAIGEEVRQYNNDWHLADKTEPYDLTSKILHKVLWGERVDDTNKFRGGHSPRLLLSRETKVLAQCRLEANGVKDCMVRKLLTGQGQNAKYSNPRRITVAPTTWTDSDIAFTLCLVAKRTYFMDHETSALSRHAAIVNDVPWVVVKTRDEIGTIISAYPVTRETLADRNFPRPPDEIKVRFLR